LTGRLSFSLPDGHDRRVSTRINIEAIIAWLQNGESLIGSVNFVDFPAEQMADVNVQCTLMKRNLNRIFVDIGQRQAGLGTDAQKTGP
jgi:hypothetical protein